MFVCLHPEQKRKDLRLLNLLNGVKQSETKFRNKFELYPLPCVHRSHCSQQDKFTPKWKGKLNFRSQNLDLDWLNRTRPWLSKK